MFCEMDAAVSRVYVYVTTATGQTAALNFNRRCPALPITYAFYTSPLHCLPTYLLDLFATEYASWSQNVDNAQIVLSFRRISGKLCRH